MITYLIGLLIPKNYFMTFEFSTFYKIYGNYIFPLEEEMFSDK